MNTAQPTDRERIDRLNDEVDKLTLERIALRAAVSRLFAERDALRALCAEAADAFTAIHAMPDLAKRLRAALNLSAAPTAAHTTTTTT